MTLEIALGMILGLGALVVLLALCAANAHDKISEIRKWMGHAENIMDGQQRQILCLNDANEKLAEALRLAGRAIRVER